ncbi:four helix bundle protein [Brevundimonas sp. AJA228-03]|uniref:four helix bundle protein n=1 Tax=Brevundimonas sp. AJA228-03 TaxID=2752515 RepID=UPI001AE0199C|nr:four helix bundle protein [Brevundimonas sp. AJA228-03]QTN19692.1 four helix bundle protein [Brevundimonas sp. AJA228-03]
MASSHRDLVVWQKGVDLACDIYRLTRLMPREEAYRISGQIIRASSSIPANLAEGNGRATRRDYAHFVSIARGSAAELETFLIIIGRLELAPKEQVSELLVRTEEIGRMLTALRSRLATTTKAPPDT